MKPVQPEYLQDAADGDRVAPTREASKSRRPISMTGPMGPLSHAVRLHSGPARRLPARVSQPTTWSPDQHTEASSSDVSLKRCGASCAWQRDRLWPAHISGNGNTQAVVIVRDARRGFVRVCRGARAQLNARDEMFHAIVGTCLARSRVWLLSTDGDVYDQIDPGVGHIDRCRHVHDPNGARSQRRAPCDGFGQGRRRRRLRAGSERRRVRFGAVCGAAVPSERRELNARVAAADRAGAPAGPIRSIPSHAAPRRGSGNAVSHSAGSGRNWS